VTAEIDQSGALVVQLELDALDGAGVLAAALLYQYMLKVRQGWIGAPAHR
jgi:hypothetical protein